MTTGPRIVAPGSPATPKVFAVWFKDLERWSVGHFQRVEWRWPAEVIRPIGDALRHKRAGVDDATDRVDLPIIEKITFGGVVSVTSPKRRAGYKGRLFWAESGDLIYSKIRVKQGSLAVVPASIERLAVSAEYPVYQIDELRADGRYLELVVRSSAFLRMLDGIAHGGSTKTRIPPNEFEKQPIPLPPLAAQRAIVSAWEQSQAQITDTRRQIAQLEGKIEGEFLAALGLTESQRATPPKTFAAWWEDLERWSVMFNQLASAGVDMSTGKYTVAPLSDVAAVSYGVQKSPANRPGDHARPYLRVANVRRGELDLREVKSINVPDADMPNFRLEPGDLLFVEGNGSRNELGRCAVWNGEIEDCVHQNHILKVRPCQAQLLSDYAGTWFNTETGKDHFFRSVKTSSGLGTINSTELRAAPIPLPPLSIQRQLVAKVKVRRRRIAALTAEAGSKAQLAKADMEAMILGQKAVTA